MCRSRRELSNEYLLAKIGVDTAENEPLEVWGKIIQYHSIVSEERRVAPPAAATGSWRDGPTPSKRCVKFTHRFLATFCDESAASFNREKMLAILTQKLRFCRCKSFMHDPQIVARFPRGQFRTNSIGFVECPILQEFVEHGRIGINSSMVELIPRICGTW